MGMQEEEFINICVAEGLTKSEAEYGWTQMPAGFEMPSDLINRRILIQTIRHFMPDFIWARPTKGGNC